METGDRVRGLRTATLALLFAAVWLAGHPYLGIAHDGKIYAAEAMRWLQPGFLDDDILFAHGFQAKFTVFPALYGSLAGLVGLHAATMMLYVAGQLLWLAAAFVLIRALVAGTGARWLLLFALALLPADYGSNRVFVYAEPYATPRPFAEGLVLLGLGLWLGGRKPLAGLALAAGLVVHPLVAWPGAGAVLLAAALRGGAGAWRRRALVLLLALLPVALAVAGIAPFDRLFTVMDAAWFEVVDYRDAYVLVGNWTLDEWARPFAAGLFVTLALVGMAGEVRRLALASMVLAGLGFAAALLLGETLHSVLVINLQPWRAVWLLTVLANLAAAMVLLRLLAAREPGARWLLALFLAALGVWFLDRFFHVGAIMTLAATAVAGIAILAGPRLAAGGGARLLLRLPLSLCAVGAAIAALASTASLFAIAPVLDLDTIFFREIVVMAPALAVLLLARRFPGRPFVPLVAAALIFALALPILDRRSAWARHYARHDADAELHRLLPADHSVYFEGGIAFVWFTLRRASYLSCEQGSASIFNRDLALAYARRHRPLAALGPGEFLTNPVCRSRTDPTSSTTERAGLLLQACRDLDDLDLLVLTEAVAGVPHAVWRAPLARVTRGAGPVQDFHIYDCAGLR